MSDWTLPKTNLLSHPYHYLLPFSEKLAVAVNTRPDAPGVRFVFWETFQLLSSTMGDTRKAQQRKPKSQKHTGSRKSAGTTKKKPVAEKPKPLNKKPSVSKSDADAAKLLIGLGGPCNPMDNVFDAVMGISPEENAALDVEQYGELEDHNDEETHSEELSDSDYTIAYKVPFNNATREFKLSCTTPFSGFLTTVLRKMEVSITHLSAIGYITSYKPKNPKPVPKLLETTEDYERMMEDIAAYRKTCLRSKAGKIKPFSISLSDTSCTPTDGRTKTTSKKKGPQPAALLEASEKREHELMADIEKHHACQDHTGKACYVLSSGDHHHYTNNDLVIWATLIRRDLALVDKVPDQLKIEDKFSKQKKAKNAVMQTQMNSSYGPMWPQMPPAPWMYGMPWMMPQGSSGPFPAPVPAAASSPSPTRKHKYPAIKAWLQDLDNNEDRGVDGQNYEQYADVFAAIGIIRLDDLLDVESLEKLQDLTHMNWGTAKRIIKFAKEDHKKLKKAHID
ncbi:hypothetical protein K438DRAFT_1932023 [Mycena galopus ATCC 62051]|nr:hypothetical protein K438DRAFT_1932023 [Mycena galopus ATCC 62051]